MVLRFDRTVSTKMVIRRGYSPFGELSTIGVLTRWKRCQSFDDLYLRQLHRLLRTWGEGDGIKCDSFIYRVSHRRKRYIELRFKFEVHPYRLIVFDILLTRGNHVTVDPLRYHPNTWQLKWYSLGRFTSLSKDYYVCRR